MADRTKTLFRDIRAFKPCALHLPMWPQHIERGTTASGRAVGQPSGLWVHRSGSSGGDPIDNMHNKIMAETVRSWGEHRPDILTKPHPRWRTTDCQKHNLWFDGEIWPELSAKAKALIA